MTTDFKKKTTELIKALNDEVETLQFQFGTDRISREWLSMAYDEPDFFVYKKNFLSIHDKVREKSVSSLTLEEALACVTFCIRKMRFEYPPYKSITDNVLANYLNRVLELSE